MSNRTNTLFDTVKNFLIGLWNNTNIVGQITLIVLSPIAFAVLMTLLLFKLGFKLLTLLVDEVNFYWGHWAIATTIIVGNLDEFIKKKIYTAIKFLWMRLFNDEYKIDKAANKLSDGWLKTLSIGFLAQLLVFVGLLLIAITLSSLIYSVITEVSGNEINLFTIWLFRFFLLTPLIHRYIRYKIIKKPFSWKPEPKKEGWIVAVFYSSWFFVIITVVVIIILTWGSLYQRRIL